MSSKLNSTVQTCSKDRIAELYPKVNENETPLPRSWSPKDKFTYIGLSQNNLRVHYKGVGKTHKDAASVRTIHPISPACGLYYFEIKIVSKGRDGYIGIGLSTKGVNMNRLPGWEKNSYGYHGDDGHSFCSSGTGQSYGPTFTTGDVIGCGVNLADNNCFYTKNGIHLGTAFIDLPQNLYPTVGLQTPGEVVDANFGKQPFLYDIGEIFKELKARTKSSITRLCLSADERQWQSTLQRIVSTYLVHHGYCSTAEAFSRGTGQTISEDLSSMKNRQRIQKLILAGRISEGIEATHSIYPGLMDRKPDLLFNLKCRQFIEMISGADGESKPSAHSPTRSTRSSPCASPVRTFTLSSHHLASSSTGQAIENGDATNSSRHADSSKEVISNGVGNGVADDNEMEVDDERILSNQPGPSYQSAPSPRGTSVKQLCGGNLLAIEKLLSFGRELRVMAQSLSKEGKLDEESERQMMEAFSLLAYNDPWSSPVGYLLKPVQRENVCAALNSAILESYQLPGQPSLELSIGQIKMCLKTMAKHGLGSCAFADVEDFICTARSSDV